MAKVEQYLIKTVDGDKYVIERGGIFTNKEDWDKGQQGANVISDAVTRVAFTERGLQIRTKGNFTYLVKWIKPL